MSSSPTITQRRVFYIPGYDPIHPRRYRELYRKEGADQAALSGYDITLRPKTIKGPYGWHVTGKIDGHSTETDVEVLVWSDIVRDSMGHSILATYLQLARTAAIYIGTGALFRLMRLRKGPVIAALYPVGMLLLQLVIALGAAWGLSQLVTGGVGELIGWLAPDTGSALPFLARLPGWIAAAAFVWLLLNWFRSKDNRLFAYYLMHDYSFSAKTLGRNPAALEARMADFADRIAAALTETAPHSEQHAGPEGGPDGAAADEVLIIGHSSGAHLAISILADLIRDGRVPKDGPVLSFLSLGQVVPMVSFLPRANRLRADLAYLAVTDQVTWVDVTAPGDGCAFALCDPVAVTGVAPADTTTQKWPLVLSAAFTQTLSPARWKELRWRFFRLHFQYLCAFDAPGDYDYFQITAGPMTLGDRFRDRAPSKSRITKPVNRYRSRT